MAPLLGSGKGVERASGLCSPALQFQSRFALCPWAGRLTSLNKENACLHFICFWRELNMTKYGKREVHSRCSMMVTDVIIYE